MKVMYSALLAITCVGVARASQDTLSLLENRSQQSIEGFRELNRKINIPDISNAILVSDSSTIKNSLQDVMTLNRTITSQIDSAIGFWNIYLDNVMMPSKEGYLMGQVMASFLSTLRSLFLRSSVDQAMILSMLKKAMDKEDQASVAQSIDARDITIKDTSIETRWKNLHL